MAVIPKSFNNGDILTFHNWASGTMFFSLPSMVRTDQAPNPIPCTKSIEYVVLLGDISMETDFKQL